MGEIPPAEPGDIYLYSQYVYRGGVDLRNMIEMGAQIGQEDIGIIVIGHGNETVTVSDTALFQ